VSENNLKRDYERIWLTDELGEVNWCQDRITADDVEFVRADIYQSANAEIARLREVLTAIIAEPEDYGSETYTIKNLAREALAKGE